MANVAVAIVPFSEVLRVGADRPPRGPNFSQHRGNSFSTSFTSPRGRRTVEFRASAQRLLCPLLRASCAAAAGVWRNMADGDMRLAAMWRIVQT